MIKNKHELKYKASKKESAIYIGEIVAVTLFVLAVLGVMAWALFFKV